MEKVFTKTGSWDVGSDPLRFENIQPRIDIERILKAWREDQDFPEDLPMSIEAVLFMAQKTRGKKDRIELLKIAIAFIKQYESKTESHVYAKIHLE